MKNSALKRIIAVVLCLVVFAGSELTGVTNIVGDLFASENSEIEMDAADPVEETEEIVLSEEEPQPEEETEEVSSDESQTAEPADEIPSDVSQSTDSSEISAEETPDDETEAPADTEGENGEVPVVNGEGEDESAPVTDTNGEEESENPDGEKSQDEEKDSQETEASAGITKDQEDEIPNGDAAETEGENPEDTENGEETEVLDEEENGGENEEEPEAFDEEYKDGQVIIRVEAEPGVVPNGTELSVKKIVQQDVEALDDEEEIKEAEELNAKYEDIQAELELTVADDDTKEIAAFVAYDVNFLLTDEDGVTAEIEPDGEVSVSMEFEEAYLPEEIAEKAGQIDIESIDVIHMEEAEEDEESETGLKSEVVADADVSTTENAVEKAEFTTGSGKTFVITWTENDLGEREYVCETDDATIKVTAAKGVVPDGALLKVVPILADNEATQKQYQDVEKKLLEKAESEAYEIAGFLAYDISFTDEAGAKLEPNGEVKVAIDYKKAAIPEELKDLDSAAYAQDDTEDAEEDDADQAESAASGNKSAEAVSGTEAEETSLPESGREDGTSESGNSQSGEAAITNITIMHLEENDQGQVTKVVDMGAEGKVTELNSTKDQKVTSTEFVTESFSTFTIVWMDGGNSVAAIEIEICDETGNQIELSADSSKLLRLELNCAHNEFKISEIKKDGADVEKEYYQLTDIDGVSYTFVNAVFFGQTMMQSLKFENNKIFMINERGESTEYFSGMPLLKFHYKKAGADIDALPKIDTIDNDNYGITMKMINYDGDVPQENLLGKKKDWWIDEDGGGKSRGDLTQGAVERRLNEEGYPVSAGLIDANTKGKSLAPLFGGGGSGATTVDANHLFSQNIYEETGYFEYSSFENYAYLKDDGDFAVYTGIGTPSDADAYYYQRGNFLPYNKIEEGKFSRNTNQYDPNGNKLTGGRLGENLYKPVDQVDYAFGMYIEATFSQPRDGQVTDSKGNLSGMRYEFNGDDDLWVFIDDSLILDIGGSHHARSGWIDFASGTVHIEEKDIEDTTIRKLFFESGYFPDGSVWKEKDDPKADNYFKGNTFADYSTHTVKMFYMEHGGEASNLHVKMNLPTVQKKTVEVEKQLSTEMGKYKDVEFAFQVLAEKSGYEVLDGEVVENINGNDYVILNNPVNKKTQEAIPVTNLEEGGKTYKNVFYLKPGEVARFSNLDEGRNYFVREIGLKSDEYDRVTIRSTTVENVDDNGGSVTSYDAESSVKTVGERPRVVYINECSEENSNDLRITKQMSNGTSTEDTFTFKVTFGDNEIPLTDPYYLVVDGEEELKPAPSDGVVTGVPANGTVVIKELLTGTKFKVEEIDLDEETYTLQEIRDKGNTFTLSSYQNGVLTGEIKSNTSAEVIVENALKGDTSGGLRITKKLSDGAPAAESFFEFNVSLVEGGKEVPFSGEYLLDGKSQNTDNGIIQIPVNATAVIKVDDAAEFKVMEVLKEGYDTPQITVNGETTISGDVTVKVEKGQYTDITVTNVPKAPSYGWEIVKQNGSADLFLKGARFQLSSLDGKITYYGLSDEKGVVKWYENEPSEDDLEKDSIDMSELAPGKYTLLEYKAPNGYNKIEEPWIITITEKETPTIDSNDNQAKAALGDSKINGIKTTFYIKNDVIPYELPSTGGIGIHWYMVSGTLLMMAGILILYKRKCAGRC